MVSMAVTKTILLTGASGFVGQRFVECNKERYVLKTVSLIHQDISVIDFTGVDTIVHLAGMAHQMQKIDAQIYFDVNTELTKKFALAAKAQGVKHFIFISTIKVFGEHQKALLTEGSPCEPINDPYGESKLQAEKFLESIEDSTFTVAIVRPPLVYGPRVKGNLIRFLKLADSNKPLPFANISNKRTMVFLDNLIALINVLIDKKASGLYLAADDKPISTTYLIGQMRKNMGHAERLFPIPMPLKWALKKVKPEMYIRLYGSLEMNPKDSFDRLNFKPPYSIEEGIKEMVKWYKSQ
jgi:nucleoside-diphosphate-sugar epimerase